MPDFTTFSLFLTAAFILSITPGPGILYTLARSFNGGRSEGIASALGLFVGGLVHVVAAAIGLSSLLMTSAIAFTIVKYAGAASAILILTSNLSELPNLERRNGAFKGGY